MREANYNPPSPALRNTKSVGNPGNTGGGTVGGYTNEAGYRSGWHLTNALTFGRVAGKNMAAEKPWA